MRVYSQHILFSFLLWGGVSSLAVAEEQPKTKEIKTFEELGYTPPFRVVAFTDDPTYGDCNGVDAIKGECLERVFFEEAIPQWSLAERFDSLSRAEKNILRYAYPGLQFQWLETDELERNKIRARTKLRREQYAKLYAQLWDDLVYRWKLEDDPGIGVLKKEGFRTMPTPRITWDALVFNGNNKIAAPELSAWINERNWIQFLPTLKDKKDIPKNFLKDTLSIFPQARYALPDNYLVDPKQTVILKGRFAVRLGVNGKKHDFELMDANPVSSGPFFEQMYPYRTVYAGEDERKIPLRNFQSSDFDDVTDSKYVIPVASLDTMRMKASVQFMEFYRLIATQVMQFSMEDYTLNHMRILGTLNNMRVPPDLLKGAAGGADFLNASAIGQTDTTEAQESQIDSSQYSIPAGFAINYNRLPLIVTLDWTKRLNDLVDVTPMMRMTLTKQAEAVFGNTLLKSAKATVIEGLTDEDINNWVVMNIHPGREKKILLSRMRNMALRKLMEGLDKEKRDQEETWLLRDHVGYETADNMN